MFRLWLKALVVALFTAGVFAQQQDKNVPASTFYLEQTETQFSISLANNSSDVYIYFTSPAYSWVGVGFGESMKNSLMLIMYPNAKGDNVTVSPRLSTGHSEPSFAPGIQLDILNGTGFSDEMFVLKAVCRTCHVWSGGFLDASSSAQPMIFAFGPGLSLQSNDLNAPLKRHVRYGRFTMDMAAATSADASVPKPETQLRGVTIGGLVKDHDRKNLAHAIVGCLALFVLWPLNVILAGFFRNIKIHIGMSVAILCFLVIAYGLGISTSFEYNRAKGFSSPHQIFAFIALLPVLLLSLLPIRAISSLKPWIPRLHTSLTNVTFIILVLTGGLGLRLASATNPITLVYVAIALVVFIFITLVTLCVRRRGSAYARATTRRRLGEEDSRDFGLAKWGARKKVEEEAESGHWYPAPQGHARSASAASNASGKAMFGGGTMPGPQYLMNMHPGVPVYVK